MRLKNFGHTKQNTHASGTQPSEEATSATRAWALRVTLGEQERGDREKGERKSLSEASEHLGVSCRGTTKPGAIGKIGLWPLSGERGEGRQQEGERVVL